MSDKTVKPKSWSYQTEFKPSEHNPLEAINWIKLFNLMKEVNIKYLEVTFTEIVDWDMAPMRRYLHGICIPAWVKELKDRAGKDEKGTPIHIDTTIVKNYFKAKYIGWNVETDVQKKWAQALGFEDPIKDFFQYLKLQELNNTLVGPIEQKSTTSLSPEEYWDFITNIETEYWETFDTMYDKREKPEKPNE